MSQTSSNLIQTLKEELVLENFFLSYRQPKHFCTTAFKTPKHFYLIWCLFWGIYHVTGVFMIFFIQSDIDKVARILAYATIWGYISLCLTALIDLAVVICFQYIKRFKNRAESQSLHWSMKISWVFTNVSYTSGVLISFGYWTLLYSSSNNKHVYLNVMEHAVNSLYILLNLFITAKPIRIYHAWQSVVGFIIYIIFSLIYFFSGGTSTKDKRVIYFFTNWNRPSVAIPFTLLLLFVGLPIVHAFLYSIYRLKLYLVHKTITEDESTDPKSKLPD